MVKHRKMVVPASVAGFGVLGLFVLAVNLAVNLAFIGAVIWIACWVLSQFGVI